MALLALGSLGSFAADEQEKHLGVDERALLGEPQGRLLEGEELGTATQNIASDLRCPVCQGLSVADSPTPSAKAMFDQVEDLLGQGYTRAQIMGYFETSYGEFVRLSPRADGFNLIVWLGPVVALIAGAMVVAVRIRGSSPSTAAAATEDESLDPYLERVRRDLSSQLPGGKRSG